MLPRDGTSNQEPDQSGEKERKKPASTAMQANSCQTMNLLVPPSWSLPPSLVKKKKERAFFVRFFTPPHADTQCPLLSSGRRSSVRPSRSRVYRNPYRGLLPGAVLVVVVGLLWRLAFVFAGWGWSGPPEAEEFLEAGDVGVLEAGILCADLVEEVDDEVGEEGLREVVGFFDIGKPRGPEVPEGPQGDDGVLEVAFAGGHPADGGVEGGGDVFEAFGGFSGKQVEVDAFLFQERGIRAEGEVGHQGEVDDGVVEGPRGADGTGEAHRACQAFQDGPRVLNEAFVVGAREDLAGAGPDARRRAAVGGVDVLVAAPKLP
mmetsp:Transcript_13679/g.44605  ORF Transcript_13679/g.44605 Transcript_13679/m.44605 type:complete len:318 (-) Transcript_13679:398-1351(-)